jgi:hypothetical protein
MDPIALPVSTAVVVARKDRYDRRMLVQNFQCLGQTAVAQTGVNRADNHCTRVGSDGCTGYGETGRGALRSVGRGVPGYNPTRGTRVWPKKVLVARGQARRPAPQDGPTRSIQRRATRVAAPCWPGAQMLVRKLHSTHTPPYSAGRVLTPMPHCTARSVYRPRPDRSANSRPSS